MVKQFPMAQKHTSRDSMIFTLNSGSAYIDFKDSYLSMDVTNISTGGTSASSAYFGTSGGSACNFINRLTISSRSGQIIERIDRVNQLCAIRNNYEKSLEFTATTGSMMGLGVSDADLDWKTGETIRFVIPLGCLSTFFDTTEQLVPCQLASGTHTHIYTLHTHES